MTTMNNPYDALYTNLKNRLTVVSDGAEYTVGEYMLMKAGEAGTASLPSTRIENGGGAIVAVVNYVNERLTVKAPPIKDRTIKRFPLRTSFSALLSAVAAAVLMVSCCIYAVAGASDSAVPYTVENPETVEAEAEITK
ncbi:MAG: hypothetical protein IKA64_04185 [Clostridia bacterium]|nr:hypothetical protein [Clostridia bacterium]